MPCRRRSFHGFAKLGLLRIYAEPYAGNRGSALVLEKAGFAYEGCLRANVYENGQVQNGREICEARASTQDPLRAELDFRLALLRHGQGRHEEAKTLRQKGPRRA